jgi:hypothetical protein
MVAAPRAGVDSLACHDGVHYRASHVTKVAMPLRFAEESEAPMQEREKLNRPWSDSFLSLQALPRYSVIDIHDGAAFRAALATCGLHSVVAQADAIAFNTRRVIHQQLEQDPAFYAP